jgi:hypothetical protein
MSIPSFAISGLFGYPSSYQTKGGDKTYHVFLSFSVLRKNKKALNRKALKKLGKISPGYDLYFLAQLISSLKLNKFTSSRNSENLMSPISGQ